MCDTYFRFDTDYRPNIWTAVEEESGIWFREENGCLYGASPSGARPYAEDWVLLADLTNRRDVRLYSAGLDLEAEMTGVVRAAIKALND